MREKPPVFCGISCEEWYVNSSVQHKCDWHSLCQYPHFIHSIHNTDLVSVTSNTI